MLENSLLAERVLFLATGVIDGCPTSAQNVPPTPACPQGGLTSAWVSEVVPLARHLAWQAEATPVGDSWKQDHAALVAVWTDRAVGLQMQGEALALADRSRWAAAMALIDKADLAEKAWFQTVNAKLLPLEVTIVRYP